MLGKLCEALSKDSGCSLKKWQCSQGLTAGCLSSINPSARCNFELLFSASHGFFLTAVLLLFREVRDRQLSVQPNAPDRWLQMCYLYI